MVVLTGCASSVRVVDYGALSNGDKVHKYIMTNPSGASVQLCDYGARFVAVNVPDRDGKMSDVVVGFDECRFVCLGVILDYTCIVVGKPVCNPTHHISRKTSLSVRTETGKADSSTVFLP